MSGIITGTFKDNSFSFSESFNEDLLVIITDLTPYLWLMTELVIFNLVKVYQEINFSKRLFFLKIEKKLS